MISIFLGKVVIVGEKHPVLKLEVSYVAKLS